MPFFNITDAGCLINMGEEKVNKVFLPSNVMGVNWKRGRVCRPACEHARNYADW